MSIKVQLYTSSVVICLVLFFTFFNHLGSSEGFLSGLSEHSSRIWAGRQALLYTLSADDFVIHSGH